MMKKKQQYKIGDLICQNSIDGIFLCRIITIQNSNDSFYKMNLIVKRLYDISLEKPFVDIIDFIFIPQQQNEILTKNDFIEIVQKNFQEKQNNLNKLKERGV